MLGHVDNSAAIFAADRQALDQAQHDQRNPRGMSNRGIGRQETDQRRATAHHDNGDEEGVLAADEITDAPEYHRADRTDDETGGQRAERREHRCRRIIRRKQHRAHEYGKRAVDEEIVPLEHGAECRGENDLPLFASREIVTGCCRHSYCIHRHSPFCLRPREPPARQHPKRLILYSQIDMILSNIASLNVRRPALNNAASDRIE